MWSSKGWRCTCASARMTKPSKTKACANCVDAARGHGVVSVFEDRGISGAKGRDKRPGFDAMLKAAVRREFDMLAVWSSDRLGRSLQHLIEVLQTIRDTGSASTSTRKPSTRRHQAGGPCSTCWPCSVSSSAR